MFDSIYFRSKSHFEVGGMQSYLVFQPVYRYFKKIAESDNISVWKSKRLSDESVKPHAEFSNSLAPALYYISTESKAKIDGSCLKQKKLQNI